MHTRISAGVGDHPCFLTFITMIPIDCKITNCSLYLYLKKHMSHSVSNQQGILGHLSDFDKTWCVCNIYGAHNFWPHTSHSFWFMTRNILMKNWSILSYKIYPSSSLCNYFNKSQNFWQLTTVDSHVQWSINYGIST